MWYYQVADSASGLAADSKDVFGEKKRAAKCEKFL
jgi:hypothetical protein